MSCADSRGFSREYEKSHLASEERLGGAVSFSGKNEKG